MIDNETFYTTEEDLINDYPIIESILYGKTYRETRKGIRYESEIEPKASPMDLPYKLCQAMQRRKTKKKKLCACLYNRTVKTKVSLLEKSLMSQAQYDNFLATPRIQNEAKKTKMKKKVRKYKMDPCPPRFVRLAIPNKTRVLSTWTNFQDYLSTESILRLEDILFCDQNIDPKDARYYYKKIDKMKKKVKLKKDRLKMKLKRKAKEKKNAWLVENITETAKVIIKFFKDEQLFSLNFKQFMISNVILSFLERTNICMKPKRGSKNRFDRTIVEITEKLSLWIDSVTKFIDVQAIESEVDIPPIRFPSFSSIYEEEEEEEVEEEETEVSEEELQAEEVITEEELEEQSDHEQTDSKHEMYEPIKEDYLMDEERSGLSDVNKKDDADMYAVSKDLFDYSTFKSSTTNFSATSLVDNIAPDLFNILNDLIKIYEERSPADYLANEIETVPGYTYFDILNKMKEITTEDKGPKKSKLEEAMIQWLTDVAPDQVNERTLKAIHEYACALLEQLKKQGYTDEDIDRFGLEAEGLGATTDEEMIAQPEAAPEGTITAHLPGTRGDIISSEPEEGVLGFIEPEEMFEDEMGEAEIIYEVEKRVSVEKLPEGLEGVIYGHKPAKVQEHSPDAICCLSLKIWAVWLLEVTHNAHMWTKWMHEIIKKVREFASIVRGDVKLPDGNKKVLYKSDWKKFVKETETKIIAWRQYSAHVKELSDSIIENFKNKKVFCCPKCLQDHLIKNVVAAHETLQALTDAMNCAQYWRKCLDGLVQTTSSLTSLEERISSSEESSEAGEIVELSIEESSDSDDGDSFYELEEIQGRRYRKP